MTGTGTPEVEALRDANARQREELADTVDALAAKLDVKSRARDQVQHVRARAEQQPVGLAAAAVVLVAVVVLAVVVRRRPGR